MSKQTLLSGHRPTFTRAAKSNDAIKVEINQPSVKLLSAKTKERPLIRQTFTTTRNAWEMNVNSLEFE
jgi:hypothetical protein